MSKISLSLAEFIRGLFRRFYWWLSAILLNPWDVYERFIRDQLPPWMQFEWPFGGSTFLYVFIVGLFISSLLTYHELHLKYSALEHSSRRETTSKHALNRMSRLRSIGISHLFANHVSEEVFYDSWLPLHERWEQTVERHLRQQFSDILADRFRDLGELPGKRFVADRRYNQRMNMLSKELEIIDEALKIPRENE